MLYCHLIYSGRQTCGRTSRGHTGGRLHRISHPPSFCGACLNFSREKDSAVPFPPRRPWSRMLCTHELIVLYFVGHDVRENPTSCDWRRDSNSRSQRQKDSRLPTEPPGRPAVVTREGKERNTWGSKGSIMASESFAGLNTVSIGVLAHPLDCLSRLDCSTTKGIWTPTDTSKESSRRDLWKTTIFGFGTLLVVEQSSLESRSRVCAKTPMLTVQERGAVLV